MKEGQRHLRRSSLKTAEARFKKAAELKPKNPEPLAQLGWCQINYRRFTRAKQYFRQALALNRRHGESLYGLGYTHSKSKDYSK